MPEPPQPQQKLRVPDVAREYGLTERFVRKLVFNRDIPFYKVGKVILFDRDDLDRWFEEQRVS
jgi:excisionase family DNA binding protein